MKPSSDLELSIPLGSTSQVNYVFGSVEALYIIKERIAFITDSLPHGCFGLTWCSSLGVMALVSHGETATVNHSVLSLLLAGIGGSLFSSLCFVILAFSEHFYVTHLSIPA